MPEFQDIRILAASATGSIAHVVVYRFDRFSRNVEDGAYDRMEPRWRGIALRSALEASGDSLAGRFLTTMLSAAGQFDNATRAERTVTGMNTQSKSSRWQWPAPTGHLTGGKSTASPLIDPDAARKSHDSLSLLPLESIQRRLHLPPLLPLVYSRAKALHSRKTIPKILVNPLCSGEILIKGWEKSARADFEPLISLGTFARVRVVPAGHAPARPYLLGHKASPPARLDSLLRVR
jgi:hypothetical protein